jgi:hypothetical protein
MAAYNPRNFDLGQFMNDLFQQPDLANQLQFLGSHLQVINSYAAGLEIELTRVTAIATTAQAQAQAQPGTLGAAPTSGTSNKVEVFADPSSKPVLDSASTHTSSKIPDNARIRSFNHRDITLTIEISPAQHTQRFMKMKALLDSGANAIYIDKAYAQKMKLPLTLLADPIPVYNGDGTQNAAGSITHCAEIIIQFQEHRERVTADVTDLGKNQMILGSMWLSHHNPEIDWTTGTVQMTRCPWTCQTLKRKPPFARQIES